MRPVVARQARRLLHRASTPSCAAHTTPVRRRTTPRPISSRTFQRTFLTSIFKQPPRPVRPPEYEPGWMTIMLWRSRMLDNLRPPPHSDLLQSLDQLMKSKLRSGMPLNSTQALQCRRLLEWLAESSISQQAEPIGAGSLLRVRRVLLEIEPLERTEHHVELAKAIYRILLDKNYSGKLGWEDSVPMPWCDLVKQLCLYGAAREAWEMVQSKWDDFDYNFWIKKHGLVAEVARALAREGHEKDLVEVVDYAETHGVPYDFRLQDSVVCFFAERDRIDETRYWLDKPNGQRYPSANVHIALAELALRKGLQDWATSLVLKTAQEHPPNYIWDALLQSMLLLGRTVDDLDSVMGNMVSRKTIVAPTVQTFNGLLRVAVQMKDADLANEIFALCKKRKIRRNGETLLIMLSLHLEVGQMDAAKTRWQEVQKLQAWGDSSTSLQECRRLVSQYLTLLGQQPRPDFPQILSVLEFVDENQIGLVPETVAVLCQTLLENEQTHDVMDLLSSHCFMYSAEMRHVVQLSLASFCMEPKTSTARSWEAYQLLYQFFQDADFDLRSKLIQNFFNRKRPDMAVQVLGHMRTHRNQAYRPRHETYITCLEGLAAVPDRQALATVHNMLKIDTTIQLDTKLYTALMIAYTACGEPRRAIDFWQDISFSQEGPTYASIEAIFWALEKRPTGDNKARDIWRTIEMMDLDVPPAIYNAYVGAIAADGQEQEAERLIVQMAGLVGTGPDATTLGITYNALPGQQLQSAFKDWAQRQYPHIWAELEKVGKRMNAEGLCLFKVKRVLKA
ncbi:hypothetical protein B0I35DRAFT_120687 [Stachybotrys elegans]|uniref:Pentacotripeptide-repeat region of PRORP domain-containing protein n=1 Tax=Stachybotrys elegans TaxID=80388 RepID=A0A8K0SZ33_9HYPO|nr:hypothetical protein B0I35DRAFT_120687 [Stachybotrys elegans]